MKSFIRAEVPYRLTNILEVDPKRVTLELTTEIVNRLYEESDIMFNYDAIDAFIVGILKEHDIPNSLQ